MGEIARWTTPAIFYKPSKVAVDDIDEIFLVFIQAGKTVLVKCKDCATITPEGFLWTLEQEDTGFLTLNQNVMIKIDYLTVNGMRYTTRGKNYKVSNSGLNGVI